MFSSLLRYANKAREAAKAIAHSVFLRQMGRAMQETYPAAFVLGVLNHLTCVAAKSFPTKGHYNVTLPDNASVSGDFVYEINVDKRFPGIADFINAAMNHCGASSYSIYSSVSDSLKNLSEQSLEELAHLYNYYCLKPFGSTNPDGSHEINTFSLFSNQTTDPNVACLIRVAQDFSDQCAENGGNNGEEGSPSSKTIAILVSSMVGVPLVLGFLGVCCYCMYKKRKLAKDLDPYSEETHLTNQTNRTTTYGTMEDGVIPNIKVENLYQQDESDAPKTMASFNVESSPGSKYQ